MPRGKTHKLNFTITQGLSDKIDEEFIQAVRSESGYKLSRSELIQILFEMVLEGREHFQIKNIFDRNSLKIELKAALKK
jgi:hypothetical protein